MNDPVIDLTPDPTSDPIPPSTRTGTVSRIFKRIIETAEGLLGTLTVVCPELIIKKGFRVKEETADTLMRISAKHFYNYLGHWLTPDIGLKTGKYSDPYQSESVNLDGTDVFTNWQYDFSNIGQQLKTFVGRGYGVGPFSYDESSSTYNDLTKALDKKIHSLPSPINRNESNAGDDKTIWETVEHATDQYYDDTTNNTNLGVRYSKAIAESESYVWEGEWGDPDNQFETEVTFNVNVKINNDRVPGSITGDLHPTGAKVILWAGDSNDYDSKTSPPPAQSYYSTPSGWGVKVNQISRSLKKFYNPFFSTGQIYANNDGQVNYLKQITIKRPPFSDEIHFHAAIYLRGGTRFINVIPSQPGFLNILNIDLGLVSFDIGDAVWRIVVFPFTLLQIVVDALFGKGAKYNGRAKIKVDRISQKMATIDKINAQGYPLYMNFKNMSETAYLFNQFEYPAFDRNPCFPYTNIMHMKKPYLLNKVVQNQYHYNSPYSNQIKITRKYKYFVPNLFRLTFETNIGVFLEQLSKQHDKTRRPHNFLTKTSQHTSFEEPTTARDVNQMDEHLDQLVFPTNSDKWNTYIENGWSASKADVSFLSNFISSAANSAPITNETMPAEYASVFSDYPALNVNSISEIDAIIGTHADLKNKLEADNGRNLNTWTSHCKNNPEYHGLSDISRTPKNLSYKLIEFMLWYLDDNGKAFEIRNAVSNLIRYEQELDERISSVSESSGPDLSNYHVIGTELYDRECKE